MPPSSGRLCYSPVLESVVGAHRHGSQRTAGAHWSAQVLRPERWARVRRERAREACRRALRRSVGTVGPRRAVRAPGERRQRGEPAGSTARTPGPRQAIEVRV